MQGQDLSHRQTWDVIPLLVNGSASSAEQAQAQAHLSDCSDCRDELAFQMRLLSGMTAESDAHGDPHAGLRQLLQRIDDEDHVDTRHPPRPVRSGRHGARRHAARVRSRRLLAVVLVQSVALALLGVFLLARPGDRAPASVTPAVGMDYRVLSRAGDPAPAAAIRLVPAPVMNIAALQALLAETGLRIVAANRDNTIYTLAWSTPSRGDVTDRDARTSSALARLRAQPGILLAEPIAAPPVDPGLQ